MKKYLFLSIFIILTNCEIIKEMAVPTVIIEDIYAVTPSSVTIRGVVTDTGGEPLIECGFLINTVNNRLTATSHTASTNSLFILTITGLSPNTLYYLWAYASNAVILGTGYSTVSSFTTLVVSSSVPNTNTFSLQDVWEAIYSHTSTVAKNLENCFFNSIPQYFDPLYDNASYAPALSMKRFRNYGPTNIPDPGEYPILVPQGFSPNGDGVHDYFEVYNLEYYPTHKMSIFDRNGILMYQKTNDYHLFPWNGKYGGSLVPIGNYSWVLEINGSPYKSGFVMVSY